jgi:hypothetical protein
LLLRFVAEHPQRSQHRRVARGCLVEPVERLHPVSPQPPAHHRLAAPEQPQQSPQKAADHHDQFPEQHQLLPEPRYGSVAQHAFDHRAPMRVLAVLATLGTLGTLSALGILGA